MTEERELLWCHHYVASAELVERESEDFGIDYLVYLCLACGECQTVIFAVEADALLLQYKCLEMGQVMLGYDHSARLRKITFPEPD